MGPIWVLSAPDGPHVVPMNLVIKVIIQKSQTVSSITVRYVWEDSNVTDSNGATQAARVWEHLYLSETGERNKRDKEKQTDKHTGR